TYDDTSGAWTVGNLPATGTAVLSITARVTALTSFTNTASRTAGNEPDLNPANDTSSVSGTTALVADLSITKTDDQTLAIPGAPLTYTITVQNAGPSDVVGAPVSDTFPPPLTGASWSCTATPGRGRAGARPPDPRADARGPRGPRRRPPPRPPAGPPPPPLPPRRPPATPTPPAP